MVVSACGSGPSPRKGGLSHPAGYQRLGSSAVPRRGGPLHPGSRVCVRPFRERCEYVPVRSLSDVLSSKVPERPNTDPLRWKIQAPRVIAGAQPFCEPWRFPEGTTIAPRLRYGAPDTRQQREQGLWNPAGRLYRPFAGWARSHSLLPQGALQQKSPAEAGLFSAVRPGAPMPDQLA